MDTMRRNCLFAATLLALACGSDDADGTASVADATTEGSTTDTPQGTSTTDDPSGSTSADPTDPTDAASSSESTDPTDAVDSSGGSEGTGPSSEGSSSGGVEASPECMTYCAEFLPNCGPIPDVEMYDDEADCLQTCAGFAHGAEGEFVGDTVECRVAHLTFDPMPGPGYYELHCFHAQEHPTSQCV